MTQEQAPALKACPFCGGADHLSVSPCGSLTADMPARPYRVVCYHLDCDGVQGPVGYGRFEAIAAWNTRTPDPAVAGLVEALEAIANDPYQFGQRIQAMKARASQALKTWSAQ